MIKHHLAIGSKGRQTVDTRDRTKGVECDLLVAWVVAFDAEYPIRAVTERVGNAILEAMRADLDGDNAQGLAIATQFGQKIQIVLTRIRMAGDKHHHQRFVIYQRLRPVTEPRWGIVECRQLARGQFQYLQRRFACRPLQATASQVDDPFPGLVTKYAMAEMDRRRTIQQAYNKENGITPKTIQKAEVEMKEFENNTKSSGLSLIHTLSTTLPQAKNLPLMIAETEKQMINAADNLDFELAAELRDRLFELREMSVNTKQSKKGKR